MSADEVEALLVRAAMRAWPEVARPRELPYQDYWKKQTQWLAFHAPRIGPGFAAGLVAEIVELAVQADKEGRVPRHFEVSEEVRRIWGGEKREELERGVGETLSGKTLRSGETEKGNGAWEHAAERAAAVKDRFASDVRSRIRQGCLI